MLTNTTTNHTFLMDIATANAKVMTAPSTRPLTWQHDIKSLTHRKQVDGSKVHYVHLWDICLTPPGNLMHS